MNQFFFLHEYIFIINLQTDTDFGYACNIEESKDI